MSVSGYRLGIRCCFCGGSVGIDEASCTTECSHCGSILRIARESGVRGFYISDGSSEREVRFLIDRHFKKNGEPLASCWGDVTRFYLPFWRLKGVAFSTIERTNSGPVEYSDLQPRIADESPRTEVRITPREVSFCANEDFAWGIETLGVRPQVVTLNPLDNEFYESRRPLPPTIDLDAACDRFRTTIEKSARAVAEIGENVEVTTVLPEAMLIYFPIWFARFSSSSGGMLAQFDPVAKRVVATSVDDGNIPYSMDAVPIKFGSIQVMPHRCPNCGRDLPEHDKSVAYYCTNCRRMFVISGLRYRRLGLRVPVGTDERCRLFPFWIFDIAGSQWPKRGDLLRALSLIGFSHDLFYVPAFEIANPSKLLRLISHYNRRNNGFTLDERTDGDYVFTDATLSADRAAELIVPLIAATKTAKGYRSSEAPVSGRPVVPDPDLIWLPYTLDRYFWREQITGAVIEKAVVRV